MEEPESGATYPMKWKVTIPSEAIELEITPAFPEQELITNRSTRVTYWEGRGARIQRQQPAASRWAATVMSR